MESIHRIDPGWTARPTAAIRRARRGSEDESAFERELEHLDDEEHARKELDTESGARARMETPCAPPGDDEAGRRIDLTA